MEFKIPDRIGNLNTNTEAWLIRRSLMWDTDLQDNAFDMVWVNKPLQLFD